MNENSNLHPLYGIDVDEQMRILRALNDKYKKGPPSSSSVSASSNSQDSIALKRTNSTNSTTSTDSGRNTRKPKQSKSTKNNAQYQEAPVDTFASQDSIALKRTNSTNSTTSTGSGQNAKKPKQSKCTKSNNVQYEGVCVDMDFELLKMYGQEILNDLDALGIEYGLANQICPNLIAWRYKGDESERRFETVLLILNWKEVIEYVSSNNLLGHVKNIMEKLPGKQITLGLYGLKNYFKQKFQKKSQNDDYKDTIMMKRCDLDCALTDLEIRYSCCHRFLENKQDIVDIIAQFTKSIAQLPEKLKKKEKFKNIEFCITKDNRDCVLVDKNGNGFRRLWQQQLTTFDLVRLETAEAILSKYPTPSKLLQAYDECVSKTEGIKLLEDIPIRRAAGPLSSARRIGPELSNKLYNFFNAADGNVVI